MDLDQPLDEQEKKLTFWLSFLNSARDHSKTPHYKKDCWKIIVVGLHSGIRLAHPAIATLGMWPEFTIEFLSVNIADQDNVDNLISKIENEKHSYRIPTSYKQALAIIEPMKQAGSIFHFNDLFEKCSSFMSNRRFKVMIQFFHSIKHFLLLPRDFICISPQAIFEYTAKLCTGKRILTCNEFGEVCGFHKDDDRYHQTSFYLDPMY